MKFDRDYLTAFDLLEVGISPDWLRQWPIPEYTDDRGVSYWWVTDVLAITQGGASC